MFGSNSQQPNQREIEDALLALGPQQILAQFQRGNEEYWRQHGLRMPEHHLQVGQVRLRRASGVVISIEDLVQGGRARYQILPQIRYESKRYFQPLPAITFVTATTNYVRLEDAMNGQLANLQRAEDLVFFGDDSLSQKQSLRLEVCRVTISGTSFMMLFRLSDAGIMRNRSMSEIRPTTLAPSLEQS